MRTYRRRGAQGGFGLLLLLFAVAALGAVLAGHGQSWRIHSQREREAQLLFIGKEFSRALASYREASPQGSVPMPQSLDELVEDKRFVAKTRHLRRIYSDPMTGQADWQLVMAEGRIVGIHSRSSRSALRRRLPVYVSIQHSAPLSPVNSGALTTVPYASWVFVPLNADSPDGS